MNYKEIVINTKDLPSPEPMGKIMENLCEIQQGVYIKMEHRMSPKPLFPILKKNGYDFLESESEDGDVVIYIFLKEERDLKEYLEGLL